MEKKTTENRRIGTQHPMVVKYVQPNICGIQSHRFSRHCIGYVINGKKNIYYGDERHEVNKGCLFYLGVGHHYIEDLPDAGKPFEQIVFYYSPDQISWILSHLSTNYGLSIDNFHSCENCVNKDHVTYPAWNSAKTFFNSINQYMKDDFFSGNGTAESIKMTELAFLILSKPDCCLANMIIENIDTHKENFEQIVNKYIFEDITIEELAKKCNRSLTSFKKEFKKLFFEPPHKWFIRQRLMRARMLLISTSKSIAEIGIECKFPNTSHFIKLFKNEYGMTPANYRNKHEEDKKKVRIGEHKG